MVLSNMMVVISNYLGNKYMEKNYNYCLDYIKGIACIFVVFMHCEFPGKMGIVVQAISRFCVPLFFMVSGYFCYNSNKKNIGEGGSWLFNKKVKHILKITFNASIFYLLFAIAQSAIFHNINWNLSLSRIISLLLFNQPFIIAGQLWFLFALLYVYVIYAFVDRYKLHKYAYILAGICFILYIILAQGMHLMGISIPNMVYRNFLIEGFAYFMLGHWIHKNYAKLQFNNSLLITIIITSTFLCLIERYLLGRDFGVNISTIPQVFCLFLYAVNNPFKHKGYVQEIGKRYSMYTYILHPFVWHSLGYIYEYYNISTNMTALYIMPICVLVLSLLFSHIMYMVNIKFLTASK